MHRTAARSSTRFSAESQAQPHFSGVTGCFASTIAPSTSTLPPIGTVVSGVDAIVATVCGCWSRDSTFPKSKHKEPAPRLSVHRGHGKRFDSGAFAVQGMGVVVSGMRVMEKGMAVMV
eukprot:2619412-Rhodomonas_salina.2